MDIRPKGFLEGSSAENYLGKYQWLKMSQNGCHVPTMRFELRAKSSELKLYRRAVGMGCSEKKGEADDKTVPAKYNGIGDMWNSETLAKFGDRHWLKHKI